MLQEAELPVSQAWSFIYMIQKADKAAAVMETLSVLT